ncbi:MAG: multidrug effflux MFS transporter [Reinekea sp.]|jgi:MFS transporter, DHA1 family, multidrug resistance protein
MSSQSVPSTRQNPSLPEFIALIALMTSLTALAIDAMLPALPSIAEDLNVSDYRHTQWVVTSVIFGMAFGQLLFGPVSDAFGRKFGIISGIALFCLGAVISMMATTLPVLLIGRLIQGFGVSGPRIATMALVRDQYVGDRMARVMSFVMMIFIIVPMMAPMVGQAIITFVSWRAIFALFIVMSVFAAFWLAIRQPETLTDRTRRPFRLSGIIQAAYISLSHRRVMVFSIISGLGFGSLLSYIVSSQSIFQDIYQVGDQFPFYFAALAFGLGLASLANSALVVQFGSERLAAIGLSGMSVLAGVLMIISLLNQGVPPLWSFMTLGFAIFFCIGILFGNVNSLAMVPLGKMAGIGAAVVGSVSNVFGVLVSALVGWFFDATLTPIFAGIMVCAITSLVLMGMVKGADDSLVG